MYSSCLHKVWNNLNVDRKPHLIYHSSDFIKTIVKKSFWCTSFCLQNKSSMHDSICRFFSVKIITFVLYRSKYFQVDSNYLSIQFELLVLAAAGCVFFGKNYTAEHLTFDCISRNQLTFLGLDEPLHGISYSSAHNYINVFAQPLKCDKVFCKL